MAIAADNTASSLGAILQAIPGLTEAINGQTSTATTNATTSTQNNSGSTTTNSGISADGLNALLSQLLSGTGGLAQVAGGQNTAGLYNSTVQQQSVNDLITRTAGEVAAKGPTSTTVQNTGGTTSNTSGATVTAKAPTLDLGSTLLEATGGLAAQKALSSGGSALANSTLVTSITDALGLTNSAATGAANLGAFTSSAASAGVPSVGGGVGVSGVGINTAGFTAPTAASLDTAGLGSTAGGVSAGTGAADAGLGAGTAGINGSLTGGAIDAGTAGALGFGGAAGLGAGLGAGGTAAAIAGATDAGLAAGGATLGGIGGAIGGDVAASTAGIAAAEGVGDAAAGVASAGGIGDALASIGTALAAAWVVCTELEAVGEMDHSTYQKAAPDFVARMTLKPSAVRGYHYWAIPYTRLMRRKDWIGTVARAVMRPIANGRAKMINGKPNLFGYLTFLVIEPICSVLGNTVARKPQNWQSLYSKKQGEK